MNINEIKDTIESWAYIEAGLRRARNREEYGSVAWQKMDNQLQSVSNHLDRLEIQRDRILRRKPVFVPKPVQFFAIEAV